MGLATVGIEGIANLARVGKKGFEVILNMPMS